MTTISLHTEIKAAKLELATTLFDWDLTTIIALLTSIKREEREAGKRLTRQMVLDAEKEMGENTNQLLDSLGRQKLEKLKLD